MATPLHQNGTLAGPRRSLGMPRYHFDLIGKQTILDHDGLDLGDDMLASDAADRLANELYSVRPELRRQHCSILVGIIVLSFTVGTTLTGLVFMITEDR